MPDRSLRLLTLPQQSVQGGERSGVLLRERPASPPDTSSDGKHDGGERGGTAPDDNPFAPPPEGTPDRPWQPRHPEGDGGSRGGGPRWGGQWSDRQPGRSPGGFGERPGGPGTGPGGAGRGAGPRWDPTDPAQRRARYSLLCGMWAFFFALFGWPYVALLLGALALYWGISSVRTKPRTAAADPDQPVQGGLHGQGQVHGQGAVHGQGQTPAAGAGSRPQTTAAVSGLVTASLAILLVATSFAAQLVYRDYYTCRNDALTSEAQQSCSKLLPEQLRSVLGDEN